MHIIFDGRSLAHPYTGLGRFTGELLFELLDSSVSDKINYTVIIWNFNGYADNVYFKRLKEYSDNQHCRIIESHSKPVSLLQHLFLHNIINNLNGDIYFHPHFDLPLGINIPTISVIHDLFPLKVSGYITKFSFIKKIYFRLMLRLVAKKSSYIFCVSETTKEDFLSEVGHSYSDKVDVSLEGPIIKSLTPTKDTNSVIDNIPDQFLLYVGDRRPHKNLKRIVDLFVMLRDVSNYTGKLLLVGSLENHDFDLEAYILNRNDIIVVGHIDDHSLAFLYTQMEALIFLSKYEGFGLPVVEAGLFGKKMIISDGGSLPEVMPPWAFVVPNNAHLPQLISNVTEYLNNPITFDKHYSTRFSWQKVAQIFRRKFTDIIETN